MEIRTIEQSVDELTYRSYSFNRQQFPKVEPERWAKVFADAERMESRFQREHSTE